MKAEMIKQAFNAGYNCYLYGASLANCDFRLFSSPETTAAWEEGRAKAESDLAQRYVPNKYDRQEFREVE